VFSSSCYINETFVVKGIEIFMMRKISLVLALAAGPVLVTVGCSRGSGAYKIMRAESMSGRRIVAAMVAPGVVDETLKTWGKEISDKQGTKEPVTVMFFEGENKMRATYAAGMLISYPAGGVQLPK
jgi:hypothetical protein